MSSGLFAEVYLDEDVSTFVARLVRARGFEALAADEAGNKGLTDAEQLDFAVRSGRAIVTHNRTDFEALARQYAAAGTKHFGIIIAVQRRPAEIARRLCALLNSETADELIDQVRYI